jgi:hypothetical protein
VWGGLSSFFGKNVQFFWKKVAGLEKAVYLCREI